MFGKVYQGFYKNYYLRSSYEYVYLKVLEKLNINFKMEMITYTFKDGSSYTPDFFILNNNGDISKIVEIKAEDKEYYAEGLEINKKMQEEYGIIIEMLSLPELRKICRNNGLSFDVLSKEWKEHPNSSKMKDNNGVRNPMYGKKHSLESKIKNGNKTRERFQNNPEFKKLHSEKVKEAMLKVDKNKLKFENRSKNVEIVCALCGKKSKVYTSQTICCDECRSKYSWEQRSKMLKKIG